MLYIYTSRYASRQEVRINNWWKEAGRETAAKSVMLIAAESFVSVVTEGVQQRLDN